MSALCQKETFDQAWPCNLSGQNRSSNSVFAAFSSVNLIARLHINEKRRHPMKDTAAQLVA